MFRVKANGNNGDDATDSLRERHLRNTRYTYPRSMGNALLKTAETNIVNLMRIPSKVFKNEEN